MFGRRDNSGDQRILVSAEEPISETGGAGEDLNLNDGGMSYQDVLEYARRKKWMLLFVGTGITILLGVIIGTVIVTASSHTAPVVPTTPTPTSTTTQPTTTTTPTTKPTTTTTPTTTTSKTTTTTPTTTTPTTTTSKPTTTTQTTTTEKTTTTPTTTTETPHPSGIPTVHPLPKHPETLPATTLLQQVFYGTQLHYTEVDCGSQLPLVFKCLLSIEGVAGNYSGESTKKELAKTAASQFAASSIFGLHYDPKVVPPAAPRPCKDLSIIPDESEFIAQ